MSVPPPRLGLPIHVAVTGPRASAVVEQRGRWHAWDDGRMDFQRFADLIAVFEMERQESERTILCEPGKEHALRAAVDQIGAANSITIKPSPTCPEGRLLVVDEGAMAATQAEWLQRLSREPLFPWLRR